MGHLNIASDELVYRAMIGTGGIGAGQFFALKGNHPLGREESRSGHFLKRKDYCKLHIISHYVKVLLGPAFEVIPVSKVGGDEIGDRLLREMKGIGLNLRYVQQCHNLQTLFSFCFIYPDGSGGNLTADNSACSRVNPACIAGAERELRFYRGKGIALAVPEVPLAARKKLIESGKKHDFFCCASFTSGETIYALRMGILEKLDLLALNIDEASLFAGKVVLAGNPALVVKAAVKKISAINPDMFITITAGRHGSWSWDGKNLRWLQAHRVKAESTAGAGDAFFSGIIAALAAGLTMSESHQLANIVSALSVTSPDTINKGLNKESIRNFVNRNHISVPGKIRRLLN